MRTNNVILGVLVIPLLLALLLSQACSRQSAETQATITDENGVMVIENPLEPMNPELEFRFEEELRIGTEYGDENTMFGSRVLINADQEGNIYVSDQDINTVKKYDKNGGFLLTIGGPGQGPGEFQNISETRFDAAGNIYLNDDRSQRITFMSRDGEYVRGVKAPFYFERVLVNSRGHYFGRAVDNVKLKGGKSFEYYFGLFDGEFTSIAELLRQPQRSKPGGKGSFSIAQALANDMSSRAFVPMVSYVLDERDMLYFGYPEEYEIKVYSSLNGELEKIIRREHSPIAVTGKHKELFEQNQSELFRSKMPAGMEDEVFELVEYPEFKAPYERFVLLENGWIFVVVDSMRSGPALIDIFSQQGYYLAQFETKIPTEHLLFKNGKAYSVEILDDYQYIVRYTFEIVGHTGD